MLDIKGLKASVAGKEILKGISLNVKPGEVHAIMGPNGSGKSTLAQVLAGNPAYEVPGVSNAYFLRSAYNEIRKARGQEEVDPMEFVGIVEQKLKLVDMDPAMLQRSVNTGFSGGEKKRNEILQMAVLEPKLSILDETDSGLDIDALRIVADGVNKLRAKDRSFIVVTH